MKVTAFTPVRSTWEVFQSALKAAMPWISRKRHARLNAQRDRRYARLNGAWMVPPPPARTAACRMQVPCRIPAGDELCLFVTHAAGSRLKAHVQHHLQALLDAGIPVVLIANADAPADDLQLPETLQARLSGCLIRENVGYDFAAWAHAFALVDLAQVRQRLYLVNDSVVGPLDEARFRALVAACRGAQEDLVGLTENHAPVYHLQSYFLCVGARLLHSAVFRAVMAGVVNMPTKQAVIDMYETGWTPYFAAHGFRCRALFAPHEPSRRVEDETLSNWAGLIERGLPFVKASVVRATEETELLSRCVPASYVAELRGAQAG